MYKILGAAIKAAKEQFHCMVEIMIPLVFTEHEIDIVAEIIRSTKTAVCAEMAYREEDLPIRVGTMIETPRACLKADRIAANKNVSFVSFGTNDLTQLILGCSRDDTQQFIVSL